MRIADSSPLSRPCIHVQDVDKIYSIYENPLDRLKEAFHPCRKKYHTPFCALRDIRFDVRPGETVGIIGRNGSGKSTLLQIISNVMTPTRGHVLVEGKLAALLELGAGFNPDFTGRENVFLNARLLGFDRETLEGLFDDIAAFADIGPYLEQPVRTYSSGMLVRLAFSVMAHVPTQIWVIDEALSVGDEAFQRKCFARIQAFRERGNTLVFVSHSTQMIMEICDRVLLLDHGRLIMDGEARDVIRRYHQILFSTVETDSDTPLAESNVEKSEQETTEQMHEKGGNGQWGDTCQQDFWDPEMQSRSQLEYTPQGARIQNIALKNLENESVNTICCGGSYGYSYDVEFYEDAHHVVFGSMIKTVTGFEIGGMISHPVNKPLPFVSKGTVATVFFPFSCRLSPGVYFFNAGVTAHAEDTQAYLHRVVDAYMIRVQAVERNHVTGIVDFRALDEPPRVVLNSEKQLNLKN